MNYVIVYWSRYGNGKRIVEYLARKLRERGEDVQILRTDEVEPATLPDADMYVFSAPTEAFNIQRNMRRFMKKLEGVEGKDYGIINTHAMKNKNWLHKMEKSLSKKKMVKVAGVDFQVGDGTEKGEGLMEDWEARVDAFATKL
jgi:menaquinone-dependent protoporphyrinogen IX oxidase